MNRTDELTDRLVDGTLDDAGAAELESLLAADAGACARHLALVRLELVLRGLRTGFDFAGPTVAKIEADRADRTAAAVMAELAGRPAPARNRRAGLWVALAAAVLVAVWFGTRPPGPAPAPGNAGTNINPVPVAPTPPDALPEASGPPRLVAVAGAVEFVGPAGITAAHADQIVGPHLTLRTVGEESVTVAEYPDRTRLEVHPDTAVRFVPAAGGAPRKVVLLEGRVTAVATGRRLVVGTAAADVEASSGSFSLYSSGPGSARVEALAGDVRVARGAPAEPLVLGPGRAAFVRDDQTPVRVEGSGRVDAAPRARLDFPALDVGFAPDGEVFAVSAKQWARWRPGGPDPRPVVFPPRVHNDGLAAWLTPDLRAVAQCRTDDRAARIVIRALPSGEERGRIRARVTEPRFLCVGPDASWVATAAGGPKPLNRRLRVWDATTGEERFARELGNIVNCLAASPDGRWLAVGVSDLGRGTGNAIVVFDAATGHRAFELPTRRKAITALAFTSDGGRLAAGFNGAVQVWDVPGRTLVRTLEGFERVVTRLAYSPRRDLLAAGTQDGQAWVWAADTGRRRQVIEAGARGVRALGFSADGKRLVTATNKAGVAVWDVAPEPPKGTGPDA